MTKKQQQLEFQYRARRAGARLIDYNGYFYSIGSSESDSNPRFLFLNEPRSVHNSVIQIDIEIFTLAQVIDWVIKKKNNSN